MSTLGWGFWDRVLRLVHDRLGLASIRVWRCGFDITCIVALNVHVGRWRWVLPDWFWSSLLHFLGNISRQYGWLNHTLSLFSSCLRLWRVFLNYFWLLNNHISFRSLIPWLFFGRFMNLSLWKPWTLRIIHNSILLFIVQLLHLCFLWWVLSIIFLVVIFTLVGLNDWLGVFLVVKLEKSTLDFGRFLFDHWWFFRRWILLGFVQNFFSLFICMRVHLWHFELRRGFFHLILKLFEFILLPQLLIQLLLDLLLFLTQVFFLFWNYLRIVILVLFLARVGFFAGQFLKYFVGFMGHSVGGEVGV